MAKLSVIVPVYNAESYLNRCIESILDQTFNDIEVILVDDGSTDNCGEICDFLQRKTTEFVLFINKTGEYPQQEILD